MGDGMVISGEAQVRAFRARVLRQALKLESVGLKRRGPSALSIVRREFGVKARTAALALVEFDALLAREVASV